VAKAEHLEKGENPRFVVTSLTAEEWSASALYEQLYCARGDMENRIKEQLVPVCPSPKVLRNITLGNSFLVIVNHGEVSVETNRGEGIAITDEEKGSSLSADVRTHITTQRNHQSLSVFV
jgi:hypothetical protein